MCCWGDAVRWLPSCIDSKGSGQRKECPSQSKIDLMETMIRTFEPVAGTHDARLARYLVQR